MALQPVPAEDDTPARSPVASKRSAARRRETQPGPVSTASPDAADSPWHARFGPLLTEAEARLTGAEPDFVRMADLQVIPMPNGSLSVVEVSRHLGFPVHRAYFISDVPVSEGRGGHGHKSLRQGFICLKGQVSLLVRRNGQTQAIRLGQTPQAAVVERGCWRDLNDFSEDAVVLVLASDEYDEADYIRSRTDFETWEAGQVPVTSVPYLDLTRQIDEIGPEIELAMRRVVKSGRFIGGPEVTAFEQSFASYCGTGQMVGVGNGLEALSLMLRAWGIGAGDEVIVPAHTFIATALAVDAVGATPVLVDVEPETGLIDVDKVAAATTSRTRAVIPVHLYGHPVDMDALRAVLADTGIRILEDAAQAHGARYRGRRCGSLGDAAAFSFYPTKNLGAVGDGGGIVTGRADWAQAARRLANYGATERYHHEVVGTNSRLDPVQAAVLSVKLGHLDRWNARRRELADLYLSGLADLDGLELPAVRAWAEPVWHVFPVRAPGRRDALLRHLEASGIGVNIHYPVAVHRQSCYAGRWKDGAFPVAEGLAASLLSLPLDPTHSEAEIRFVIAAVRSFFGEAPR